MNRIINMALRMLMQRAMRWGMNKGVSQLSRRGAGTATAQRPKVQKDLTPEQKKQAAQARDATRRARQMAKMARRIGR